MPNFYEWICVSCMKKKELGKLQSCETQKEIIKEAKPFFEEHKNCELMLKDDNRAIYVFSFEDFLDEFPYHKNKSNSED